MTEKELMRKLDEIEATAKEGVGPFPFANAFIEYEGQEEAKLFKFGGMNFDNDKFVSELFDLSQSKTITKVWLSVMIYIHVKDSENGVTNLTPKVVERLSKMVRRREG
jgi:hypothetical protein